MLEKLDFQPTFQRPKGNVDTEFVPSEETMEHLRKSAPGRAGSVNRAEQTQTRMTPEQAAAAKAAMMEQLDEDIRQTNSDMRKVFEGLAGFSIQVPEEQTDVRRAIMRLDPRNTLLFNVDGTIRTDTLGLAGIQNYTKIDLPLVEYAMSILYSGEMGSWSDDA